VALKPLLREIKGSLALVALLASLTSIVFYGRIKDFYEPDSAGYITLAVNMLAGKGFVNQSGQADTLRTPGYPLLILPFLWAKLDIKYLILFQHLVRISLIIAAAIAAYALSGQRRQALLSGLVLSIDLPFLKSANNLLTEIMFSAVLALVLLLLWRDAKQSAGAGMQQALAGLLSGTLVLIRPVALLFFVPAAAWILLARTRKQWRAALLFIVSFAVAPLLWSARNYRQTGYFTVSSISGFSMMQERAAGVLAIDEPGDFYGNLEKHQHELENAACRHWEMLGRGCSQVSMPEKSRYYSQVGVRTVLEHPIAYSKLAARGLGMTMLTGSPASLAKLTGINFNRAAKLLLLYTAPAFLLSLLGLSGYWRANRDFFWMAALTCMYFVGISAGAESFARFRVPILPIYGILIANGTTLMIDGFRRVVVLQPEER
jgi:glycerol uptake facilitator-like aquaporin